MKTDLEIVAKTIYGEARGEGYDGMLAVATVIYNRSKGDKSKFALICLKPKQFSCWNDTNDIKIWEYKSWETCKRIAQKMFDGSITYYSFKTINPTNYLTSKLFFSDKCPSWARGQKHETVGNHIFIELKNW